MKRYCPRHNLKHAEGRCPRCLKGKARQDKEQGYLSRAWNEIARRLLAERLLCERCGQRPSRYAHHLYGLRPSSPGGMDSINLQAVCASCHGQLHAP